MYKWLPLCNRTSKRLYSFVTSPIYYANAEPHIGHAYTAILCDTAHRWEKLKLGPNNDSIFSIGTDEHGSKIFRSATAKQMDPQQFCDDISLKFRNLFDILNVSSSHYIRTTDNNHKSTVQHLWKELYDRGHIYKSKYSGYYSIVDECFIPECDVVEKTIDGKSVKVAKASSTPVEWIEEENYMFRLSLFRHKIADWIRNNDVIKPQKYVQLALNTLEMEEDLSVSRSSQRLSWGIPVPGDSSQTIYVWLDALTNYLTVSGYPNKDFHWPPTCQVIGKDIVKFHLFYWPAFLMAIDLPLPKTFFVHGHWLVDNIKMSKSLGNVVNPLEAIEKFTSEGLRYFLLKNGNPSDDSNFSSTSCLETINSDIVNNIGNLLNRSTIVKMNPLQEYPMVDLSINSMEEYENLIKMLKNVKNDCTNLYETMMYYKAIELLMGIMKESNRLFQLRQPWKETDEQRLKITLYMSYESLRMVNILLQPIVPKFANFILSRLGIPENQRTINDVDFGKYHGGPLGENNGVFMERLKK